MVRGRPLGMQYYGLISNDARNEKIVFRRDLKKNA